MMTRFIRSLTVRSFRSIEEHPLDDLGPFTCLAGRNNSGKSNFLRALYLFFQDEPEPNTYGVSFARDYCKSSVAKQKRSKQKQRIGVEVGFDLPESFKVHPTIKHRLSQLVGQDVHHFTVTKTYESDIFEPRVAVNGRSLDTVAEREVLYRFLGQFRVRYVPNRTKPTEVLKEAVPEVQRFLVRKYAQRRRTPAGFDQLAPIADATRELLKDLREEIVTSSAGTFTGFSMVTPSGIEDITLVAGYQAEAPSGEVVGEEVWGSGIQAYAMMNVLMLVDTDYGSQFGWPQATMWLVEEPESSLHYDLEQRLAFLFRTKALQQSARMQMFCSTHSAVFIQACTDGYLVEQSASGGTTARKLPTPALLNNACRTGVSGWQHPLLAHPFNPVVLLDGPIDRDVLSKAAEVTGRAPNCQFACLEDFAPHHKRSGVGNTLRFLQAEGSLVGSRKSDAPLIVLLDWETTEQDLARVREAYGGENGAETRVFRMDEQYADPLVGATVRGIERFYPPLLFEEVQGDSQFAEMGIAFGKSRRIVVEPARFAKCKRRLADRLCAKGSSDWYAHLAGILKQVEAALGLGSNVALESR